MKVKPNLLLFVVALLSITLGSYAQVGINMDKPHPSSILHIKDVSRGVLLPRIKSDNSLSAPDSGLLYYNTSEQRFRYFNGKQWQCLNSWSSTTDTNVIITNKQVVVNNTVTATTVNATRFNGTGTIPIGGIIMWSGTKVPDGWALCDGNTAYTDFWGNLAQVPDLRGRFVVGYCNTTTTTTADPNYTSGTNTAVDAEYNAIGKPAGEKLHSLTRSEIPKHQHTIGTGDGGNLTEKTFVTGINHYDKPDINGNGTTKENPITNVYLNSETHSHTGSTGNGTSGTLGGLTSNASGAANGHENRPPYYALAYIMRIQ